MKNPEFRARLTGPATAKIFQSRPNHLGRLTWDLVAVLDLDTGTLTRTETVPVKGDLSGYADSLQQTLGSDMATGSGLPDLLQNLGQLSDRLAREDLAMDRAGFEVLLLSLEDLKQAMIGNVGRQLIPDKDHEYLIDLGHHHQSEGDLERAETAFRQAFDQTDATRVRPRVRANILSFIAVTQHMQSRLSDAADSMAKAVAEAPDPPIGMVLRHIAYALDAGEIDAARDSLTLALRNPRIARDQLRTLSRFANRANLGDMAIDLGQRVASDDQAEDNDLLHLVNITRAYQGEEAASKTALGMIPAETENRDLLTWRVRAAVHLSSTDTAISEGQRLTRMDPDFAEGHLLLARAHLQNGKPAAAIPELVRGRDLRPDHIITRRILASALLASGDGAAAAEAVEDALGQAPDDAQLNALKSRIETELAEKDTPA